MKSSFFNTSELMMVSSILGILLILFIPIPAGILDWLLIINFSWALTILLLTFYTDKPLSFSTFPALLLISTLFRLALNISATRLILSDAKAGHVIEAMGQYVIAGNYIMGLVVFLILIIVQFVVVTNGAQRVAEVAARFTLDSMPGKQMSIDADLNVGSISQDEAKFRRSQIEKEANFYGAMDGASKFVKGDAIAGILIVLVDIIGGFIIGLMQKGMSLQDSIQTYTLLTVGDGLVTQIPALIISVATGIIVTRAATDAQLGDEVAKQIAAYPKTLILVCCGLLGLLCIKNIPILPVLFIFSVFFISAKLALKKNKETSEIIPKEDLYEKIKIHPLDINLNPELFNNLKNQENILLKHIEQLRENIAFELGFIIPEVRIISDARLTFPSYQMVVQGNEQGAQSLYLDQLLAIYTSKTNKNLLPEGIETFDPSYNLPARWIDSHDRELAQRSQVTLCEPLTILTTHLSEIISKFLPELFTREETERLLAHNSLKELRDELIPAILPIGQVQKILQNLLQEKVSIRFLQRILEVLIEHGKNIPDPTHLTELVRAQLSSSICQKLLTDQKSLYVLTLEPEFEYKLNQQIHKEHFAMDPTLTESLLRSLISQVEKMLAERKRPVLLCSSLLRRHLRRLTQRIIPHMAVLGMNEVPVNIPVESFGIVMEEKC